MKTPRHPTYFISHGGGPWPWMDGPMRRSFDRLETSLQALAEEIGQHPAAILVVSGHWESDRFTVQSGDRPGMIYDYGGFPQAMYEIRYPAPGAPDVAHRIHALLKQAGIDSTLDPTRGYDHGTYAPLKAMYPAADVPILQLSLKHGYDPAEHLAVGRALKPLREEGIVILASGLSWHNLRRMGPGARESSTAFDAWLADTLSSPPEQRTRKLLEWERAPAARESHPTEDHFIPLMVAIGAAEDEPAAPIYHEENFMGGVTASSYRFGAAPGR